MISLENMREFVKEKQTLILAEKYFNALIGKKINTIYYGYAGQDGIDEFIIGSIKSQYQLAEENIYSENENRSHKNQAQYWESYMTKEQLENEKNTFDIITKEGRCTGIRLYRSGHGNWKYYFKEPTFTCSDADRAIHFILNEYAEFLLISKSL